MHETFPVLPSLPRDAFMTLFYAQRQRNIIFIIFICCEFFSIVNGIYIFQKIVRDFQCKENVAVVYYSKETILKKAYSVISTQNYQGLSLKFIKHA